MSALLEARLRLVRGTFSLDVDLRLEAGEVLALLGPNGSGKSTVLDLLAGLAAPDSGSVTLDGKILTGPGTLVPPEKRGIGLLGQDPLLFPHLSARANVAFALRVGGASAAEARRQADLWLERVGLAGRGDSKPTALSGGQQQRVALARALAARPLLLLLDEPLAALDAESAPAMRQQIREQLAATNTSAIIVTHDVVDAVVLADRVAVLQHGVLIADGATAAVLEAPRNPFIAALAGVNLVVGTVSDGAVVAPDGRRFRPRPTDAAALADDGIAAAAVFRPGAVVVQTERPQHASPRTVWLADVTAIEPSSGGVRLRTSGDPEVIVEITPASVAELGLAVGSTVWLSVKATEVSAHRRSPPAPATAHEPIASWH